MGCSCKIFDYPVFAISYADGYIVASGGGGGDNYGISNKLEVYTLGTKFKPKELHLEASTSEQNGIIDSLDYHQKHKLWIGSIDDSTIIFSYKPTFGMKIFGRFKTDHLKSDPKQNICRFAQDSNYFVTGGNERCVRLWRLSEKLIRNVNKFHKLQYINKSETKPEQNNRMKVQLRKDKSSEDESNDNSQDEGETTNVEELLDSETALKEDALLKKGEDCSSEVSDNPLSHIDDTSPSPSVSPSSSPTLTAKNKNFYMDKKNEVKEPDASKDTDNPNESQNCHNNEETDGEDLPNEIAVRDLKRDENLCKLVLEYRDHAKPINDCFVYKDLLVSICNDCMILYKLLPSPKLLLNYTDKSLRFKFVKVIKKLSNLSSPSSTTHIYALLTLQYFNPSAAETKTEAGKDKNKQKQKGTDQGLTTVTLWNFNAHLKRLVEVKTAVISHQKCSSLTVDLDEEYFALGFGNGSVSIYSIKSLRVIRKLHRHKLPVTDLSFTDKDKLLTSGIDYYVFINDIKKNTMRYFLFTLMALFLLATLLRFTYL